MELKTLNDASGLKGINNLKTQDEKHRGRAAELDAMKGFGPARVLAQFVREAYCRGEICKTRN